MSAHRQWRDATSQQFGAAMAMLENAIRACPDHLWADRTRGLEFWRLAYHTLFWLDCYLAEAPETYRPPAPFSLDERDPGAAPDRIYTPEELLGYLGHARARCRERLAALTVDLAGAPSAVPRLGLTAAGLLIYNLRHVQHGAAQLNLLYRQATGSPAPPWVRRDPES